MSQNNIDFKKYLHKYFGFRTFLQGQLAAISNILDGKDTLIVMPTGSGKSLCYQLPSLLFDGVTLIISPLIALMKDQVDMLQERKIPATFINSSLSSYEKRQRLSELKEGNYKIIYVSPERLRNQTFLQTLSDVNVSFLAVDEAHCISQWGHDFRPDYLHIRDLRKKIGRPPIMALTATATQIVQDDIIEQLNIPDSKKIVTGFDRPNLEFRLKYASNEEKKLQLIQNFFENEYSPNQSGVIYVGTRQQSEFLQEFLQDVLNIESCFYHAGLEKQERKERQELFITGKIPVIIATNAFGMGIDKPDIRFVIHYQIPSTLENYYQEVGRAGRDSKQSQALLLYSPKDHALQKWFIENDSPTAKELRKIFRVILNKSQNDEVTIEHREIEKLTGVHPSKLEVAIEQLEKAGALLRLADMGGKMKIQLLKDDSYGLSLGNQIQENRKRRRKKLKNLQQMINYAETNKCRRSTILSHFGDKKNEQIIFSAAIIVILKKVQIEKRKHRTAVKLLRKLLIV